MLSREWDDLPLTIERKTVTHTVRPHRTTAIVHLEGGGEHGYGEEVTFQERDLLPESPQVQWRFSGSFREFSLTLASRVVFEREPEFEVVDGTWTTEAANWKGRTMPCTAELA